MANELLQLKTPGGICRTEIITPSGSGPWPAVILAFDAGGQRASISEIGERIAKMGYLVAIPDFYHRAGNFADLIPAGKPVMSFFKDPALREQWQKTFRPAAMNDDNIRQDVGALLDALKQRKDFSGKVGSTGYCMGGNISLRIAIQLGARIQAAASFHGGGLVTDAPDSPHKHADKIKAQIYVAGAKDDSSFTDEMKQKLIDALNAAHVKNTVETYPGKHGFAVRDHDVFDEACAQRHDKALEKLFGETLR